MNWSCSSRSFGAFLNILFRSWYVMNLASRLFILSHRTFTDWLHRNHLTVTKKKNRFIHPSVHIINLHCILKMNGKIKHLNIQKSMDHSSAYEYKVAFTKSSILWFSPGLISFSNYFRGKTDCFSDCLVCQLNDKMCRYNIMSSKIPFCRFQRLHQDNVFEEPHAISI